MLLTATKTTGQKLKLLDQVRHVLRAKHYSIHTQESYINWIKKYILCHHKRHPKVRLIIFSTISFHLITYYLSTYKIFQGGLKCQKSLISY